MVEEAVSASASAAAPTLWAVINSWLTPTVFFVVLQFVIATIYITSNIATTNQKHQHQQNSQEDDTQQQQQLPRSPLQRHKSINFHSNTYRSQEPPPEVQNAPHSQAHEEAEAQQQEVHRQSQIPGSPTILPQRLKSINQLHKPTTDTSLLQTSASHESEKHHHLDHTRTTVEENDEDQKGEEAGLGPSLDEVYRQLAEVGQGRHFKRSQSDTTPPSDQGQVPAGEMKKSASTHFKEDEDAGVDAKADDFINRFKHQLKLQRFDSLISRDEANRWGPK